jgi:hypothetical protein
MLQSFLVCPYVRFGDISHFNFRVCSDLVISLNFGDKIEQPTCSSSSIMVATRQQRAAIDGSSNPVNHAGILELVLGNLVGQGLYVSTVSKSWRACYEKLAQAKAPRCTRLHVHSNTCTSYAAVFASPARLLWAHDWKLQYYVGALDHISNLRGQRVQRSAGRHADIGTLQIAHQHGLAWTPLLVRSAALSGSVPKLAWLCDEQRCLLPDDIMDAAAESGNVEMLQWLKQRGHVFSERTTLSAARKPHNISVLQFLMEQGCDWHDSICGAAAGAGDLEQLKWLHQHGATLHSFTTLDAAGSPYGGVVSIFEWLQQQQQQQEEQQQQQQEEQQQRFELTCHVMSKAAEYGHLSLCQWLHNAGCPWDSSACRNAVDGGYLEVLRFLHDNGCPWDGGLILYNAVIATHNNASMLQYLWEQGLQLNAAKLTEYLNYAGTNNKLESAKWLREKGAQWSDVLQDPDGDIWYDNMVAWARAEGCTAPVGVVDTADY